MTRISIYNVSQFTSKGKLKKSAKAEYQKEAETIDKGVIARYIKDMGYHSFSTPYFFTHIKAVNMKGEEVKIFQDVKIGSNYIITSPQELIINLV